MDSCHNICEQTIQEGDQDLGERDGSLAGVGGLRDRNQPSGLWQPDAGDA